MEWWQILMLSFVALCIVILVVYIAYVASTKTADDQLSASELRYQKFIKDVRDDELSASELRIKQLRRQS